MRFTEGHFKGCQDYNCYYQALLPNGSPKAIVLVVHGLGEHSGRYSELAHYLADRSYAVYAYDHFGHGKTDGKAGYVSSYDVYIYDLISAFSMVQAKHPTSKIFIFGHSMGGLVTAAYASKHQYDASGLIFSSIALKPYTGMPGILNQIVKPLSKIAPMLGVRKIDASTISHNKDIVKAYNEDPLVLHHRMSAHMAAEFLRICQDLPDFLKKISLPSLVIHGEEDHLVNINGSRELVQRISSKDKTLITYPGMYHEVFNEPDCPQVWNDLFFWLENHI